MTKRNWRYTNNGSRPALMMLLLTVAIVTAVACGKVLNEVPASNLQPPQTLDMLEPLFNDLSVMNITPALGELSCDNYYLLDDFWQQRSIVQKNAYIWAKDIYNNDTSWIDYDICSKQVLYTNIVLEGLQRIPAADNPSLWNSLKGRASFFRSMAVFNMAQLFAQPYDASTLNTPGVPLRQTSSTDEKTVRATVGQTYNQVVQDMKTAIPLLGNLDTNNSYTPSKPAAYGMLARIYISMNRFDSAALYADSCLQLHKTLIDYNAPGGTEKTPFQKSNPEILFKTQMPCTQLPF
jgi:starch-binding outer membrane protein, SusD/RagB family